MGNKESKELQESPEVTELRRRAETEDPVAFNEYIKDNLNKWKTEKVKLAVTGMTKTGKSSFINKINGAKPGSPNFAPQGRGNTTKTPTYYQHTGNANIVFCDLPGIGSELFPKETYVEEMKLHNFDFIFLFFDDVIQQIDVWLAEKLLEMKKPFCMVRSKIDEDFDTAEDDGRDPEQVIPEARKKALESIERNEVLRTSLQLFIISSKKPRFGEFEDLVSFLETRISAGKVEAIMFALPLLTKQIIQKKYDQLHKRLYFVTAGCSTAAANPIPFLDVFINIVVVIKEIQHYIQVFGLGRDRIALLENFDVSKLKSSYFTFTTSDITNLIMNGLANTSKSIAVLLAESAVEAMIPIIGTAISSASTAYVVYKYLEKTLNDMKDDATIVYEHIHGQRN